MPYTAEIVEPLLILDQPSDTTGLIYGLGNVIVRPPLFQRPDEIATAAQEALSRRLGGEVEQPEQSSVQPESRTKPSSPGINFVRGQEFVTVGEDPEPGTLFIIAASALPEQREQLLRYLRMTAGAVQDAARQDARRHPPARATLVSPEDAGYAGYVPTSREATD